MHMTKYEFGHQPGGELLVFQHRIRQQTAPARNGHDGLVGVPYCLVFVDVLPEMHFYYVGFIEGSFVFSAKRRYRLQS